MKKLLLLIAVNTIVLLSFGQTIDKKFSIGFHAGLTQYNGDLGQNFYAEDQAAYGFGGFSFSRYLGEYWDFSFIATRGEIGNIERPKAGTPSDGTEGRFRATMNAANFLFHFNLLNHSHKVRPYLHAGVGVLMFEKKYTVPEARYDFALPSGGFGVNFDLGKVVTLRIQETFMYTNKDDIDGESKGFNDAFVQHTAGLIFNLGKKMDADLDGVSDHADKCPLTPTGVSVDGNGCPLDKDGDGLADFQDECPALSGIAALKGCPDKDLDGVADKNDNCPDVVGISSMNGCPDTDFDGITDADDRCPNVSGTTALNGCPDADGDGVADMDDKCGSTKLGSKVDISGCPLDNDKDGLNNDDDLCPDAAGPLALKGCPDSDGDGVSDYNDRCPKLIGTLENKGCPEIAKADIKRITVIASKIFYEFNSAKLKAESLPQLDELVTILKKYEGANLTIEGHTDNVGDDEYNHKLSHQRTESVKAYLMSKGIFESRLTAVGFGETKPIATNNTEAGRQKNRRVELRTSY